MNVFRWPFALIAFLGFVAVVPVWMWFVSSHPHMDQVTTETSFLIQLVLPATVALFLAGWLGGGA